MNISFLSSSLNSDNETICFLGSSIINPGIGTSQSCDNIKVSFSYAINSRIEEKSKDNFEKIFGFEYDEHLFTNKIIIEEIARIIILYK
ncbi:MAG: hypothetical protein ACI4UE_02715 [Candidatus Scatovivens sp.]